MDVTVKINGADISKRLSTFNVTEEISYKKVLKTLDGAEHPYPGEIRHIVSFSLIPGTALEDLEIYNELKKLIVEATYTHLDNDEIREMRVTSNLESVFLLRSVDGARRYSGGQITLRGL